MSDEPIYCPICGLEHCGCDWENAPHEAFVFCQTCGVRTGRGDPCDECKAAMDRIRPATVTDSDEDPFE